MFSPKKIGETEKLNAEIESKHLNLTRTDRVLIKAFFNYIPVKQISRNPSKTKQQACAYIKKMLWPPPRRNGEQNRENVNDIDNNDDGDDDDDDDNDNDEDIDKDNKNSKEGFSFDLDTLIKEGRNVPTIFNHSLSE